MSFPFAIFDIDGTLVDSRAIIQRSMVAAFEAVKAPPPSYNETRKIVGLELGAALDILAPGLDGATRTRLLAGYRDAFFTFRQESSDVQPLYDGAVAHLERLKNAGWVLGVATGKSRRGLDGIFEMHDLQRHFDTTWCAGDGPGKPDPFMVIANLEAVGAMASQAVMIGDATHDMTMALKAGVRAQGVSWGFATREEIAGSGSHHIADSFSELDAELDAFAARLAA